MGNEAKKTLVLSLTCGPPLLCSPSGAIPDDVLRHIIVYSLPQTTVGWRRDLLLVSSRWGTLLRDLLPNLPNIMLVGRPQPSIRRRPVNHQQGCIRPSESGASAAVTSLTVHQPSEAVDLALLSSQLHSCAKWQRLPLKRLTIKGPHRHMAPMMNRLAHLHAGLTSLHLIETTPPPQRYTLINPAITRLGQQPLCSQLTTFSYFGGHPVDAALLTGIPTLTSLRLSSTLILSPESLSLPLLQTLILTDLGDGSEPLECISRHAQITHLHLNCPKPDDLLPVLPCLTNLVTLVVPSMQHTAPLMTVLSQLESLVNLHLNDLDGSLPISLHLTSIQVLEASGIIVTTKLQRLEIARHVTDVLDHLVLPSTLTSLHSPLCELPWDSCSGLRNLSCYAGVQDASVISRLHQLEDVWPNLTCLCLAPAWRDSRSGDSGNWAVVDSDMRLDEWNLATLRAILQSHFFYRHISSLTIMQHVPDFDNHLTHNTLVGMRSLQHVTLVCMRVTREQLLALAHTLPVLATLDLVETTGACEGDCLEVCRDVSPQRCGLKVTFSRSCEMFGNFTGWRCIP